MEAKFWKKDKASSPDPQIKAQLSQLAEQIRLKQESIEKQRDELQVLLNQAREEKLKTVVPKEVTTEKARKMGPMDDPFFSRLGMDPGAIEEVISAALGVAVTVKSQEPQFTIPGFGTRGVRLDSFSEIVPAVEAVVELSEGCDLGPKGALVDVEVQKEDRNDTEYRVFYNGASIIVNKTPMGIKNYKEIPRAVVIWISEKDPFGEGEMFYQNVKADKKTKKVRKSPVDEIFINTENIKENGDVKLDKIAKLMKLFRDPDAYDFEAFPKFSKRKQALKTTEEGVLEVSREHQRAIDMQVKEKVDEISRVYAFLVKNGRSDDIIRSENDIAYRYKMIDEYMQANQKSTME